MTSSSSSGMGNTSNNDDLYSRYAEKVSAANTPERNNYYMLMVGWVFEMNKK